MRPGRPRGGARGRTSFRSSCRRSTISPTGSGPPPTVRSVSAVRGGRLSLIAGLTRRIVVAVGDVRGRRPLFARAQMHWLERLAELNAAGDVLAQVLNELFPVLVARVLLLGERAAHLQLEVRALKLGMTFDRITRADGWI